MTPEEQELITGLFDRMRTLPSVDKDRDADQLIRDAVRQFPDAPYLLVQSVLVQDQALQEADTRIRELEERFARNPEQNSGSGSFLGRVFGAGPHGSVPSAGRRAGLPSGYESPPWRESERLPSQPENQRAGGGFLASALSTASGVAGGMLLAESIRSMLGGAGRASSVDQAALDRAQDEAQDARQDADEARKQLAEDDAALDEAQDADDDADGGDNGIDV